MAQESLEIGRLASARLAPLLLSLSLPAHPREGCLNFTPAQFSSFSSFLPFFPLSGKDAVQNTFSAARACIHTVLAPRQFLGNLCTLCGNASSISPGYRIFKGCVEFGFVARFSAMGNLCRTSAWIIEVRHGWKLFLRTSEIVERMFLSQIPSAFYGSIQIILLAATPILEIRQYCH